MKITSAAFVKTAILPAHYPPPLLPEIAFAGRSNVGKSSLINAMTNHGDLAKASRTPGRTQAINFFVVNEKVSFVDLPGYGFARVPDKVRQSWGPMVETYLAGRENLVMVVLILDVRRDLRDDDRNFLLWMEEKGIPWQPVLTKADKISKQQALNRLQLIQKQAGVTGRHDPILFSVRTGQGKETLWRIIAGAAKIS
ncbi:MAG TPA: ribosome biogenesis GTP-binding protein YihA/YsxC [Syntrophales bacterium]|jgi:GTP-binding protein|nr:ribosome biogenesis GTP-binding protein YihA/YsxC [Syntrophales bacterium]HPC31552.1 ribosome biogenesis GTP-binding protein YihA/YsxC [Syntrophales bacterium]HQG34793.1 ribosome biogenesis GTP-binding protein YihA/YsxC [Syntrophales bacterium]HQI34855.1 ribosome biogenesis GTP-binding protein YihA/YsxC [Syntrophales bacterium]